MLINRKQQIAFLKITSFAQNDISFLDFARSDAADALVATIPHDIAADVLDRAKGPVRSGDMTGERAEIPLRPLAIQRALENLIGNALRYGNSATLSVHVTERAVRFVVEDDGPGIAPDQRADAVKAFHRLDAARNQNIEGVGLGLSITKDIAQSHGGTLRLGESEMGGLKATIRLPV